MISTFAGRVAFVSSPSSSSSKRSFLATKSNAPLWKWFGSGAGAGGRLYDGLFDTTRRTVSTGIVRGLNGISFSYTVKKNTFEAGFHHQVRLHPPAIRINFREMSSSTTDESLDAAEQARREVASDLFNQYAVKRDGQLTLDYNNLRDLLRGVGEDPNEDALHKILDVVDEDHNGVIDLNEFLDHSDYILGGNPARIILVVGGPGSGKGMLSKRLQEECFVVHLSSGDMLREEVARGSALGREVQDIMARGELVSSAIMVALMKRRMRDHPGKRVLLDGFPRSLENAHDLVTLCGKPELALHLHCDDTVLLERIIGRGADLPEDERRNDDNFETALQRLRTFHKYHPQTMEWLREQHVPIVNLDCSGPPESVWQQLQAIGRLMRPAVKLPTIAQLNQSSYNQSSEQAAQEEESDKPFNEPDWDWPFSRKAGG